MAKISTLVDNFDTGTINPATWITAGGGQVSAATKQLQVTTTTAAGPWPPYGVQSQATTWDLTGSSVTVQVVNAGNQALASWEVYAPFLINAAQTNWLYWFIAGGQIMARTAPGGTDTIRWQTEYVPANHRYLRIREQAGTVYFDYSADGAGWSTPYSGPTPFTVTALQAWFGAANYNAEASTTVAVFDNINTTVTAGTGAVAFASTGLAKVTYNATGTGAVGFAGTGLAKGTSAASGTGALAFAGSGVTKITWNAAGTGALAFAGTAQVAGPPSSGAGWGTAWKVWWQTGTTVSWDMTAHVVEARWTTDAYTTGDGSFRGDLQPGSLQMQINDPAHTTATLDPKGTIWLQYVPKGYVWGFYLDTVTRQLVAPSDPTAADVVITASPWPVRLTTDCLHGFARPAERADTRLTALAAWLSQNTDLALPRYTANVAAQSHVAPAVVAVPTWGTYPAALTLLRQAAANGVAWLTATVDGNGAGQFAVNYARWETAPSRNLATSDVVAGIPYDSSMDLLISVVEWTGTAADGTSIVNAASGSKIYNYGFVKASMRVLANLAVGQPDQAPVNTTGVNLINTHSDPTPTALSAVSCISGNRTTPAGGPGPAWNPAAHVWTPNEVLHWVPPPGQVWGYTNYRVIKTAHRLRALGWDSAHTVEPYTPAAALPA